MHLPECFPPTRGESLVVMKPQAMQCTGRTQPLTMSPDEADNHPHARKILSHVNAICIY